MLAGWQAALRALSSRLTGDSVRDVLVTRAARVLLLTDRHVVYCKAKHLDGASAKYHVRWVLRIQHVNNVLCTLLSLAFQLLLFTFG